MERYGISAGRFRWKIAGTFCTATIKGLFVQEILSCMECPFFQQEKIQEGRDLT